MGNDALQTNLNEYSEWRLALRDSVIAFGDFLKEIGITDIRTHHQLETVLTTTADDNLSIAFVAEYSRGKSELINTLFFASHKERVLPTGSGRTTMCPAELSYDASQPTSIKLLPIESRQDKRSIFELKQQPELWKEIRFDIDNTDSITKALSAMAENKLVSKQYAEKLDFQLSDQSQNHGLHINEYDEVEVPKYRHALVNFPHPLLEQGLVILDTPGLNAIGAEPELTINQLSSAHTVVFVLAVDTGVTATDLALWQSHLDDDHNDNKLIALNKIDSLWDGIRSEQQIASEIQQRVDETASLLKVPGDNIFPISAQKGLLGQVSGDAALIEKSHIKTLEEAIANRLVPAKKVIVNNRIGDTVESILSNSKTLINQRIRDVEEHTAELKQLSVKNSDVIGHIMVKAKEEKAALENDVNRYHALRAVYVKQTAKLLKILANERIDKLIAHTKRNMSRCASSVTLQKCITHFFTRLHKYIDQAVKQANEITVMTENIVHDFNREHGIQNYKTPRLRLEDFKQEITRLEQQHLYFKDTKILFYKEQMSITNRFYESVCVAARAIFNRAHQSSTNWKNNLMIPMETQVREHQTQLKRRLESVKRIHQATDTVEQRLEELNHIESNLRQQLDLFHQHQAQLADLLGFDENKQQNKKNKLYLENILPFQSSDAAN